MARWLLCLGCTAPLLTGCAREAPETEPPEVTHLKNCALTFEEVYVEHREHEQAHTLLWNAGSCHAEAGDRTQAALVFDLLIARFPDSKHVEPAKEILVELYVLDQ